MTGRQASTLALHSRSLLLAPAQSSYAWAHWALSGQQPPWDGSGLPLWSGQVRAAYALCPAQPESGAAASLGACTFLGFLHYPHRALEASPKAAVLSPDFPFVLKGESVDCQPQSSGLDLGVYSFLLQANFYSFSQRRRENRHCKEKPLPRRQHFALPWGSVLLEYFLSTEFFTFFYPDTTATALKFPTFPHWAHVENNLPVR